MICPKFWKVLDNSNNMWLFSHFYLHDNSIVFMENDDLRRTHLFSCLYTSTFMCLMSISTTYYLIQCLYLFNTMNYLVWAALTLAVNSTMSRRVCLLPSSSSHSFSYCLSVITIVSILVFDIFPLFVNASKINYYIRGYFVRIIIRSNQSRIKGLVNTQKT